MECVGGSEVTVHVGVPAEVPGGSDSDRAVWECLRNDSKLCLLRVDLSGQFSRGGLLCTCKCVGAAAVHFHVHNDWQPQ
jgi:hypothetical protein